MQRLVALHVDDDVAVERRGDFGEAIGAGLDASACVSRTLPPNSLHARRDAQIVGRDDDLATRRGDASARRYTCSIIGRPSMSASGFAGEPRRGESGGDDGDDV